MSFDLKKRRAYRIRNKNKGKFKRQLINKLSFNHASMRFQGRDNNYVYSNKGIVPVKLVYKFLRSRIGKSIDVIRREFKEASKHSSWEFNVVKTLDYWLKYETTIIWPKYREFIIEDGILKKNPVYRKVSYKRIKAHEIYNRNNYYQWVSGLAYTEVAPSGPIYMGKFWVRYNGNSMLLPVWITLIEKIYPEIYSSIRTFTKRALDYIKEFKPVVLEGINGRYYFLNPFTELYFKNGVTYVTIVHKKDIEDYKKEKMP